MSANIVSTLGIQSFCFRGFAEPAQLIDGLRACEVDRLELCGRHWDREKQPSPADVIKPYVEAGVTISSYGVHRFTADEADARRIFELAKVAGFPTISATFGPGGIEVAEKLCQEYGKKVALHNHGRRDRFGALWVIEDLFAKTSPNVGLCLDTAWSLDSGQDPLKVAEKFKDRLYGVHVKDFVFTSAGKPEDVIVGTGNLDLPALTALLSGLDHDCYLTLEYEGDVDNPVPALKQCVAAIRDAFART